MIQEDRELLMKDLCARLSYGTRLPYDMKAQVCERNDEDGSYFYNNCEILGIRSNNLVEFIRIDDAGKNYGRSDWFNISWFKPYLFPLSSMTDEQKKEYKQFLEDIDGYAYSIDCVPQIDWLNKNHFDYRGLIEKGLAIDATNLNIY